MGMYDTPAQSIRKQISQLEQVIVTLKRDAERLEAVTAPEPVQYVQVIIPNGKCRIDPWYILDHKFALVRGAQVVIQEGAFKNLTATVLQTTRLKPSGVSYFYSVKPAEDLSYHGFKVGERVRHTNGARCYVVTTRPTNPRELGYADHWVPVLNEGGPNPGARNGVMPACLERV